MRAVTSWRSPTASMRFGCWPAGTPPSTRAPTLRRSSAATCMGRRHTGVHSMPVADGVSAFTFSPSPCAPLYIAPDIAVRTALHKAIPAASH